MKCLSTSALESFPQSQSLLKHLFALLIGRFRKIITDPGQSYRARVFKKFLAGEKLFLKSFWMNTCKRMQ